MSTVFKSHFFRFILFSTGLYISWYVAYEYFLKPHAAFDRVIIDSLVRIAEAILKMTGFEITDYSQVDTIYRDHIGIEGSKGVTIGPPCDGSVLFALFACFVIAFPGPLKHKFWFLPCGIVAIHLINSLRVVGLAVVVNMNEDWLSFNHDYTFTLIVYAFVFWLWWIWINKFSGHGKSQHTSE